MAKSPSVKTNGHTVAALKPVAPKKPAVKAAAAKPAAKPLPKAAAKVAVKTAAKPSSVAAVKPMAKAAARSAAKPAAKSAARPAVKSAAKPATKPAARPAAATPVKPSAKKTAAPKEATRPAAETLDATIERKAKLVRDSFTMPEQEYAVLGQVKKACIKAGFEIKKSELLRIGVALISQLDMATLQLVLNSLPQLKTGRPKNEKEVS